MALKFIGISIASVVIGGGIGNALFYFVKTDEKDLIKHLPPYSSEKHNLFFPQYKKKSERLMNQERSNTGLKAFEAQNSVNHIEK